jgi:soluble lytic murein transglycosylase-like protein
MEASLENREAASFSPSFRTIWINGTLLALALFIANFFAFQKLVQRDVYPASPVADHIATKVMPSAVEANPNPLNYDSLSEIKKREHVRTLVFQNFRDVPFKERAGLFDIIYKQSRTMGIDPYLTLSIIATESSFRQKVISWAGAYGLMQIKEVAAQEVSAELGIPYKGEESLLDPETNITLGLRYLAKMKKRFGNMHHALTAYNYGPHYVASCLRKEKSLPDKYVRKIKRNLSRYGLNAGEFIGSNKQA